MTNLAIQGAEGTTAGLGGALVSLARATRPALASVRLPGELLGRLKAGGTGELRRRAIVSWEPPHGEAALFGLGRALELCGPAGEEPRAAFAQIRRAGRSAVNGPLDPDARPRFFGGWRFAPAKAGDADARWDVFGGWRFVVPAVTVAVRGGEWTGTATALVGPMDDEATVGARVSEALAATARCEEAATPAAGSPAREPRAWMDAVAAALDEIGGGRYEKVVLARRVEVWLSEGLDGAELRARLRSRYPNCWVFGLRKEGRTWLGASPELLVSAKNGLVEAASLAGSRKRGATAEEDRALIEELLGSTKERLEHALVAQAIAEGLGPYCSEVKAPAEPELLQMRNIQHLYTPIRGRLRNGHDVLDLAAALHPTPAVGGWPRAAALEAIGRLEGMDRGWYAAPVGWVDCAGDGVFGVGLRAGLLEGRRLTLYAGNGIVAGSEPAAELAETELKLGSVRAAAMDD